MKPSELRIGNWIYDDEGRLSKIKGMKPFDHSVRCDEDEGCELLFDYMHPVHGLMDGYECDSNRCEPIPLTPEILEKCGFEQANGIMLWECNGVQIAYETICGYFRIYPRTNKIEYLHQLQNLYWCLVGEELEIKF